jgi:hypothetical protein
MIELSYDSYESHDARFDPNLYAIVPLQKIVLAMLEMSSYDAMQRITESLRRASGTRSPGVCQTRQCD